MNMDPRSIAAAAIASGLLIPPKPTVSADAIIRRMYPDRRAENAKPKRPGDKTSRRNQAHAMKAAGWSNERIARNLKVTVRCVFIYLRA